MKTVLRVQSVGAYRVSFQSDITNYWPGMHNTAFFIHLDQFVNAERK